MKYEHFWDTPVGVVTLNSDGKCLTELRFGEHREGLASCPVLEETVKQLGEYFSGERREFTIPLQAEGTDFQRAVWSVLQTIPYGETVTYGEIARMLGNPKAVRAVGGANHRNPIAIIVPCHRVIGSDGSLAGYAGGLAVKRFLLELEQKK